MRQSDKQAMLYRAIGKEIADRVDAKVGSVDALIARALEPIRQRMAELAAREPAPGRDGRDGVAGRDGKDADEGRISAIEAYIAERRAMPEPKDGKDGRDGVDGKDGKDGLDGKDGAAGRDGEHGRDGKDADASRVAALETIATEQAAALAKQADIVGTLEAAIATIRREQLAQQIAPKDGVDGKDGLDGKDGKDGLDGKDGAAGRDGKDGRDGLPGIPGRDGKDGLGIEDLTATYDGERTLTLRFARGDVVKEIPIHLAIPLDRGVWAKGHTYTRGDVLTWRGALWICRGETQAMPDEITPDWHLAIRKPRDAKARGR